METLTQGARPWGHVLAIVARRSYRFEPGKRATADDVDAAPLVQRSYVGSINEGAASRLVEEGEDEAFGKPLTDVLVRGSAHARSPVESLDTAVEVGAARKAVRVHGDRVIRLGPNGGLSFTRPEPFTSFELIADHAYGGRDAHAEHLMVEESRSRFGHANEFDLGAFLSIQYPRNGAGRGYFLDVDRERLDGVRAPNLEDPTDPVTPDRLLAQSTTDWIDRPAAACYGPLDAMTFPRVQFLIPPVFDAPKRPVHEIGTGALLVEELAVKFGFDRPVINARILNTAPAGLAVTRLRGDERVRLWGLHRDEAFLEFGLPDDRPRLELTLPGVGRRELPSELQTVLIEPELDRVTLTWAGVLQVAMPYPDAMLAEMPHSVAFRRGVRS